MHCQTERIMDDETERLQELRRQREDLLEELAELGDMRPGSLVERYRKCGKPNCHCAGRGALGHGPSWSLTRDVGGKTVTKLIPAGPAVERTQEQITEFRRFRDLTRRLTEASEQVCDALLQTDEAAAKAAAKKGGSKRRSRPKSSRNSTRS
jgi:hypothetical protein